MNFSIFAFFLLIFGILLLIYYKKKLPKENILIGFLLAVNVTMSTFWYRRYLPPPKETFAMHAGDKAFIVHTAYTHYIHIYTSMEVTVRYLWWLFYCRQLDTIVTTGCSVWSVSTERLLLTIRTLPYTVIQRAKQLDKFVSNLPQIKPHHTDL